MAVLAAVMAVSLAACGGGGATSGTPSANGSPASNAVPSGRVALTETGSTLLYPLFNEWDPAYHQQHPNITITAQGTGSGTGIAQAGAGAVDIGASDAYLSPGDLHKNPGLLNIPLTISAQQVNYNVPGVTKHLKLNGQVLSGIYQGTITHWNDPAIARLNPGVNLPNLAIAPLHRSDGSGDTFLFTQFLSKADPNGWGKKISFGTTVSFPTVPGALGENGNGGMVSGCASTPGCVAYIGISYLGQTNKDGLGEAALGNAAGHYELPDAATIQAEAQGFVSKTPANGVISLIYGPAPNGYPIINYEYAIINSAAETGSKAQAVRAFLTWAIQGSGGNAASFLNPVQFQPLPAPVVTQSQAQIAKIGTGG
ncbi:MAG: phosphate ABC transporter substrate-binding protein PstS [Pseudonocardiales bacterium]|nr:phosphate ABC transporter substrate-binding protein PstS [Pseudonocardiales bacterium]